MAALSGPLSKRRLGTRSGELMRLSRRAETPGAKAAFETEALKARAGEGSAISSSEGNIATADYERRAAQGLARAQMGLLTTAATGGLLEARQKLFDEAKAAGGFDDAMRSRARSLGVTDSGLSLAERKIPVTGESTAATPGTTGSVAGKSAATGPDGDGNGIPDLIQRPLAVSPKPAPETPREGRINGMPASQAIAQSRESLRQGGPRQEYGADIARRNVENLGFKGALADYQRRSALDAEREKRGADYRASEAAPGSLREGIPQVGPAKPGGITMAANQSATDRRLSEAGAPPVVGPPKPPPFMGPPSPPPFVGPPRPTLSSVRPLPASAPMQQFDTSGRPNPSYYAPKQVPVYGASTPQTPVSSLLKKRQPFNRTF